MQKLIWLIGVGLLAHAQTAEIPKKIDRANRNLQRLTGPETCTTCGFPEGKDVAPNAWKECFQQVCGHQINRDEKELNRILGTEMGKHPEFAKVLPLVKEAFKSELDGRAASMRVALQAFKEVKSWDDNLSLAVAAQGQALSRFENLKYGTDGVLDEKQSYDSLLAAQTPPTEARLALLLAKKIFPLFQTPKYSLFSDDFDYIKDDLPADEIKKQTDQVLARIDELAERVSQVSGVSSSALYSPAATATLRERLQSGQFTAKDIEELKETWQTREIGLIIFSDPDLIKLGAEVEFKPREHAHRISEKELKNIENYLAEKKDMENLHLSVREAEITFRCFATFALASERLPTESDVRRYVKHEEPDLRKKFLKKLEPYLSTSSAAGMGKDVNGWRLRPPESKEAFVARLKRNLRTLKADNETLAAEFKKPLPSSTRQRIAALEVAMAKDRKIAEELNDLCENDRPGSIDDHARSLDGKFHVSGRTVMGGADANFILNHEYSHMISGFIRKKQGVSEATQKWYDATRTCLAQGHSEKGDERMEEDFADMLAASFAGGSRLFCEFTPEEEANFTLKNWNADDKSHSGNFYRVLHARVLTGEGIPDVCKAALAEKGEAPFERNCLKETPEASVR